MFDRLKPVLAVVVGLALVGFGCSPTEAQSADIERTEALAADPAMSLVPQGWVDGSAAGSGGN